MSPGTPAPAIRPLAPHEVAGAQRLVEEAGWNQLPADWQLFADLGRVVCIAAEDGGIAATAATLPSRGFGWISMVLVRQTHRRRGLASALLQHCIAHLQAEGLVPMLDATPAGRTVYQPLGFTDGWTITRWRRTGGGAPIALPAGSPAVRALEDRDWDGVLALDLQAFGADRAEVLRRLRARSTAFACVTEEQGRITGALLGRDGRKATQVGPVLASTPDAAAALLAHALGRIAGPVLLDAVDLHPGWQALLPGAGFSVERGYTRMALGAAAANGDAATLYAIAGPELG